MRMMNVVLASLMAGLAVSSGAGCAEPEAGPDDEYGMEGPVETVPAPGKDDSENRAGLPVGTNTTRTQVWTARNAWEDRATVAARTAGLAWSADSGLSWDEKFGAWVQSLAWIPSVDGYRTTFQLTTPWGKTLPSPSLECAEMAMFLRITFAAWYELPLQLEAVSGGKRVYFGHFGVRTAGGRFANTPEFAIAYKDYTGRDPSLPWPSDRTLDSRRLWGGEDSQEALGAGAVFGAYVDELHLNKRAGYFTMMTLNYLGSMNLADTANTYNIVPDAVRAGDVLVERWQSEGIGHTLVVKEVTAIGEGNLDVTTVSGSMPRRQGMRDTGLSSKSYFTSNYTGGVGLNGEGIPYARLGGGVKRFRVTKNIGGIWTNTWMRTDESSWINSTDLTRIGARPARFDAILGQVSPAQQKTELLSIIADARRHLRTYPASCTARERREAAFSDLYALGERSLGLTRAGIDAEYRLLEDDVFAELTYAESKTCCWNSTTAAMADIILAKAEAERVAAEAVSTCVAPTVFRAQTDGYQAWASYAVSVGKAASWRAWTEDETCPQASVAQDVQAASEATPFCDR